MTDLALSQPTLARYRALPRALAIAATAVALFAFSYGASVIVLNPGSGGIKAAVLLYGFLLAPPVVFFLATWVWAIADALTYRIEAWETSGQLRFLWIGLIVFVWPIGAVVWLAAIRPQLLRAEGTPDYTHAPAPGATSTTSPPWRSPGVVMIAVFAAAIIGGVGLGLLQRAPSAIHDARIGNCRPGPNVSVNITNHSATAADYDVVVRLVDGAGQEIARGDAYATALDPQHTVERSVHVTTGRTFDSCEIAEVQRLAS